MVPDPIPTAPGTTRSGGCRAGEGILWLASYPKSGNTWLRAFLANYFADRAEPVSINELPAFCFGDNFLIHYADELGKEPATVTEAEAHPLRPRIHARFASARGETALVKTHSRLARVDGIPLITPEVTAGAIYVVRNPLDVALSWSFHFQCSLDLAIDALCRPDHYLPRSHRLLPQYIGSWTQHLQSWLGAPGLRLHLVRYEDMHLEPRATFSRLVRFLGLPPEPERLTKAIRFSAFGELAAQEQREGFCEARPDRLTPFFRTGTTGAGWRALSAAQRMRLIDRLGPDMEAHGYLPHGHLQRRAEAMAEVSGG